ncbi:hypothetical protein LTEGF4_26200 (plasmid) [Limnohabitans sp. TEGF004]|nr:hypothetical protein LTEGF4_25530 [Limnohabitans sp. TEGF004]BDU56939.1 hypothetical protein LTEGF4_26200 [Limnohabitans sp. TEGF004]
MACWTNPLKAALAQLLVHEDTLSELAVLKQDAKNFGHQHMNRERDKREMLAPLHHTAKELLQRLEISRQNGVVAWIYFKTKWPQPQTRL